MQSVLEKSPQREKEGSRDTPGAAQVRFEQLTLMLTEVCNLDCWMCDFRKSEKLTKKLPYSTDEILELLGHPLWKDTLKKITLTGGEPFAHPDIGELIDALRKERRDLHINISTNGTLIKRMIPVLERHYNSRKLTLLVSVDGVKAHDVQRGESGLFTKTTQNLDAIRERFPDIPILIKFTVTPVNYHELYKTFNYFIGNGYVINAKMVENNPNYTNKLNFEAIETQLTFTDEMVASIQEQLASVLAMLKKSKPGQRYYAYQLREMMDSLEVDWVRTASCQTPTKGVFIDADLNVFTCKEYGSVLNLGREPFEAMVRFKQLHDIIVNERCNTGKCTRCTSQMQIRAKGRGWLSLFPFIKR